MTQQETKRVIEMVRAMNRAGKYTDAQIVSVLRRYKATLRSFKDGDIIVRQGDAATKIGFVLSGVMHLMSRQIPTRMRHPSQHILYAIRPGAYFGVSLMFSGVNVIPSDVRAFGDGLFLMFDRELILKSRPLKAYRWFFEILENHLAQAFVSAWQSAAILSCAKISDRVMSYLSIMAERAGSNEIVVPGNERDFASFLGVNQAALSRELNKLRRAGKITYHRNHITLLNSNP